MLTKLNFPEYEFKIKKDNQKSQIFDSVRKKFVALTPEEWVRQNMIQYLVSEKNFPASLIAVETGIKYNELQKRCDVVVHDKSGNPLLMVECKAPAVEINDEVFQQIAVYNFVMKTKYLVVTNGRNHYCCKMEYEKNGYRFLDEIPYFEKL